METVATNSAAWLTRASAPLQLKSAPFPTPGPDEIVVKSCAVAANPFDWVVQYFPAIVSHVKLPFIIGSDVAGEVAQVGSDVTRFKVGNRVLGLATSTDKRSNNAMYGAFQKYVVLRTSVTSEIPDSMTFEEACVLPSALSTAACALYMEDSLALRRPSLEVKCTGQSIVVWGASTSVGANAVQLAHVSGYDVIATASPKNADFVKNLGAKVVFDYRSRTAVNDIIDFLRGRRCAGAIAIGTRSVEACIDILAASKGRKFVAQVSIPLTSANVVTFHGRVSGVFAVMASSLRIWLKRKIKHVESKLVFGSDLTINDVGPAIFHDFLPGALVKGMYVAAPPPTIIGAGLGKIQEALDTNRKGVSARKVVVSLSDR